MSSSAFITFYPFHRLRPATPQRVLSRPGLQLSLSPPRPSSSPPPTPTPAPVPTPAPARESGGRAPPRHWGLPLEGVLVPAATGLAAVKARAARHGPVYRALLLGGEAYYVTRRAEIAAVLRDDRHFVSDGAWPRHFTTLLGRSLFSGDGPAHARRRAVVAPAFLPGMMPLFWPAVRRHSADLWRRVRRKSAAPAAFARAYNEFRVFTFAVGLSLTRGEKLKVPQEELDDLFRVLSQGFFAVELPFGLGPYEKAKRARVILQQHIGRVITEKLDADREIIGELRAAGKEFGALQKVCHEMLKEGKLDIISIVLGQLDLSRPDATQSAIDTVLSLWLAATETTAAAGSSAIYEMMTDQRVHDELVAEQDALQAEYGDLDYAQLAQMPLLDGFILEILRLRAPLMFSFRLATMDSELAGYRIPKGAILALDIRAAHLNEVDYPDPFKIDIRRHMSENGEAAKPGIVTFGQGPHTCLGNYLTRIELKTSIAILLREYNVVLKDNVSTDYWSLPLAHPACMTPIKITPRTVQS